MSVAVVVPFLNRYESFRRLVNSIENQTHSISELFIVDNGSKFEQVEYVFDVITNGSFENIDNIFLVSSLTPFNGNKARNTGLDMARSRYVAFLDSDDWWEPFHIESSIRELESANNNQAAVFSGAFVHDGKNQVHEIKSRSLFVNENPIDFLNSKNCIAQTSSYVINRAKLNRDVRWDETLSRHQDFDFFISVQMLSNGWLFKKTTTTHIDWRPSDFKSKIKKFDFIFLFYKKWFFLAKNSRKAQLNLLLLLLINKAKYSIADSDLNRSLYILRSLVSHSDRSFALRCLLLLLINVGFYPSVFFVRLLLGIRNKILNRDN
ncbi:MULTISPECIES: glycosyltransferase family A protein [Pseudidiomarina]|uniref:Glycosyltransferase involved in cell wall biosynthesis n=2 Tax=Pseudidiomarina TaxID=2800384 RepID=A0A368UL62_9GAMM|nr:MULTISPECIES: glycosyltransferase family 2 protein [Pseudidiomarina]PWW06866.1 glycosyltransferase involved in cell wall biosynthesis [Pseudidiomarina maritima]RBP86608.1 glycosyltransferase involved in cell wall biosynthesis [Pseudidiomarina tainanensis]RCW28885.1 glycosyltransferase involved in cell wall biosynthesis [Pseudidiomarina tainanensis]